jgi:hypothetical protein
VNLCIPLRLKQREVDKRIRDISRTRVMNALVLARNILVATITNFCYLANIAAFC